MMKSTEMCSPSKDHPSNVAVIGLSDRNTVTLVGVVWFKAHSQT